MMFTTLLRRVAAAAILILCFVFTAPAPGGVKAESLPAAGIGISGVNYYMTQWMFNDVAGLWTGGEDKNRGWWVYGADGKRIEGEGAKLDLDDRGYPKGLTDGKQAEVTPYLHAFGRHPAGEYVLTWKGDGEVALLTGKLLKDGPQRRVYAVNPSGKGLQLRIRKSNPSDHVRDIKLFLPGTETAPTPYHPLFLERLKPFGVIRFMDPFQTNNSTLSEWSQRVQPDSFFKAHAGKGIAYEHGIGICNAVGADFWLNVPHMASDDFVRQLATLVRDQLDPKLRVWVEYSNETWNGQFAQYKWIEDNLARPKGLKHNRAVGRRSFEIFSIFEEVFGGTDRLVRVVGGQNANSWHLKGRLAEIKELSGAGPLKADVAAGTFYLGGKREMEYIWQNRENLDVAAVHARLKETADKWYKPGYEAVAIANEYGIPYVAYEGGDHLNAVGAQKELKLNTAQVEELTQLLGRVLRDPGMADVYAHLLDNWHKMGGRTPVAFVYVSPWSKYGQWGHLEYQDQPLDEAPKFKGLVQWVGRQRDTRR
jgi:hypothetical protein